MRSDSTSALRQRSSGERRNGVGGREREIVVMGCFSVLVPHVYTVGLAAAEILRAPALVWIPHHHKMQVRRLSGVVVVVVVTVMALVGAAPQGDTPDGDPPGPVEGSPEPYQYEYKVEDKETELYHGKEEKGEETGRVEGKYYVWLPDKRLMTVTYYVDGDSGFVPTITFEDNASPLESRR